LYLVDTNVISELRKGDKAHAGVRHFLQQTNPDELYLAVQTIGELRRGVENIRLRRDADQALVLEQWLCLVVRDFEDRILDFDHESAQVWGRLMASNPQHQIDKQIAAIALIYNFIVVTRNVADFRDTGARLFNPFEDH
jgi:predicted nucleic acid-binding protein